jgi:hypothetical protein
MARTIEVLTGSGTWTVPANVTKLEAVVCIGGGGGGCSTALVGEDNGGGGGGGSTIALDVAVTPAEECLANVGPGGASDVAGQLSTFICNSAEVPAAGGGAGTEGVGGTSGVGDSFSGGEGSFQGSGDIGAGGGGGAGGGLEGTQGDGAIGGTGGPAGILLEMFPDLTEAFVTGGTGGDGGVALDDGQAGSNFGGGGGGAGTGGLAGGAGGNGTIVLIYTPLPIHTGSLVINGDLVAGETLEANDAGSWDSGDFDSWVFEVADDDQGTNNTGNIGDSSEIFTLGEPQLGKYIRAGMVQTNSGGQQTAYSDWYGPITSSEAEVEDAVFTQDSSNIQNIGGITVRNGRSTSNGENLDNITAFISKLDNRFDDPRYYQRRHLR